MGEDSTRIVRWMMWENVATLVAIVAVTLGLYWMGAGGWSLCGLLLFLNMNSVKLGKGGDA